MVRIFYDGCLQAEILPELWLLSRHSLHLRGPVHQDSLRTLRFSPPKRLSRKRSSPNEVLLSLRKEDVSHTIGTGHVAEVAEFDDGACNANCCWTGHFSFESSQGIEEDRPCISLKERRRHLA
jgi:hypothetical protein